MRFERPVSVTASQMSLPSASTLYDLVAHHASEAPDRPAMRTPDGQILTYADVAFLTERLASQLSGLGLVAPARVAVVLPTGPAMGLAFLAISSVVTFAPLNPSYTRSEFEFYLSDLGVDLLILPVGTDSPALAVAEDLGIAVARLAMTDAGGMLSPSIIDAAPAPVRPARGEGTALVLHTSGTTSRPKIVPLTHANIIASVADIVRTSGLGPDDRCLHAMPMFHIGGLVDLTLAPMSIGGMVLYSGAFSAESFYRNIVDLQPTWCQCVPTMLQEILRGAPEEMPAHGLRLIRSVAAPLPVSVKHAISDRFDVPVIETYGMTEAAPLITSTSLDRTLQKDGSVGPSVGPEIVILGDDGQPAPTGSTGEIAIAGANVITGYEQNPEANETSFRDGRFLTGDLGHLDPDGHLFLSGRTKEIINRGGQKVSPSEVDAVLAQHALIDEVATFALPHSTLGEEIAALVVPKVGSDLTTKDVADFARTHLVHYKSPRVIRFVDSIPTGPTGKIQRHKLAALLTPTDAVDEGLESLPVVLEAARKLLKVASATAGDNFFAHGGDSLLAVQYCLELSDRLGFEVPTTLVFQAEDFSDMARMIDQRSFEDNSALRVLREGAARATPLFTVNSTANYFAMATLMETDQPIYNLNMFGLTNSLSDRLDSVTIPEIASLMAQEIRDAHPDGPYQFLAFCQDGPIALELARIFRDDGIEVSSLLLIDCMFKPVERSTNRTLRNALRMGFPFVKAKLRRIVARATRKDRFADMVPERRLALMEKSKSDAMLYRRFVDLFQGYVPAEYDSPVFLFLSREWLGSDLSVVKGISTNGFEVYRLSGLHNSLFDPGSVGELASNVGTALGKVSGR